MRTSLVLRRHFLPMALYVSALCAALLDCSLQNLNGGNSSQVGNPGVCGMVFAPDGVSPAAGAMVYLVPFSFKPGPFLHGASGTAVPESTVTNDKGEYRFSPVARGTYTVLAHLGPYRAFRDSLSIGTDLQTQVPAETLAVTGSLSGSVVLEPADDPRTVLVLVMGSAAWTAADSMGRFTLSSMAGSVYRVRIMTTLDAYLPLDTVLTIKSGTADTLFRPIRLRYTGIPIPRGLAIAYDSLRQIVTLSWNGPATGRPVSGYAVYRQRNDSTTAIRIASGVTDTILRDSSASQDRTYEYRVAAVDSNGNEGAKSVGAGITLTSLFSFVRVVAAKGSGDGEVTEPVGVAGDRNGALYVVDWGNYRIQKFDSGGRMTLKFGSYGTADSQFIAPYDCIADSSGYVYVADRMKIKKFDRSGVFVKSWSAKGYAYGITLVQESTIYVSTEYDQSYVQSFSLDGNERSEWAIPAGGKGIAVTEAGKVLVSCADGMLRTYDTAGVLQAERRVGIAPQGFHGTLSSTGDFFATLGYDANCIAVFAHDGSLTGRFGRGDSGPGALNYPKDVVVIGDKIYVSDCNGISLFVRRQ